MLGAPERRSLAEAKKRGLPTEGRPTLLVADVTDLPLRDALVDKIVTTNTVYFWPDRVAGFRSIGRVLAPAGKLSVGFSGKDKMEEFGEITDHGFGKPDAEEVRAAIERAGLADARVHPLAGGRTRGDFVITATRSDA